MGDAAEHSLGDVANQDLVYRGVPALLDADGAAGVELGDAGGAEGRDVLGAQTSAGDPAQSGGLPGGAVAEDGEADVE